MADDNVLNPTPKFKKISPLIQAFIIIAIFVLGITASQFYNYMSRSNTYVPQNEPSTTKIDNELNECISQLQAKSSTESSACENQVLTDGTAVGFCDSNSCLYKSDDTIVGYTNIRGYYTTYVKEGWSGEQVTCDAFAVTDTDNPLIEEFLAWYKGGNRLHGMDANGKLLVRIDLSDQSGDQLMRLKNSSSISPVSISLIRHTPQGRSALDCESPITILDVK